MNVHVKNWFVTVTSGCTEVGVVAIAALGCHSLQSVELLRTRRIRFKHNYVFHEVVNKFLCICEVGYGFF